jgi:hypothetical protein
MAMMRVPHGTAHPMERRFAHFLQIGYPLKRLTDPPLARGGSWQMAHSRVSGVLACSGGGGAAVHGRQKFVVGSGCVVWSLYAPHWVHTGVVRGRSLRRSSAVERHGGQSGFPVAV